MLLVGTTDNSENHAKRTNTVTAATATFTCICCWEQRHVQCEPMQPQTSLQLVTRTLQAGTAEERETDRQTCAALSFLNMTVTAYQGTHKHRLQIPDTSPLLRKRNASTTNPDPFRRNRPRATVLEKLTVPQLVNTYTAFCETRRFITVSTTARLSSLSSARLTQSTYPRSILVLSSHLHVGLRSSLSLSGFPSPPHMPHAPPISSF
jgi:hypothetical protein